MTVIVTKDAINLREKLSELDKETGIKGEELMRADTSAEAREALQLDQQLFTDFESTGIDDNATSTAVTIDSSGNLLVGTTDVAPGVLDTNVGFSVNSGRAFASAASDFALNLNRNTSDGDIARFRKDGTTVGSIGTVAGDMFLGTTSTGVRFLDANNEIIPITVSSGGGSTNGTISLGGSAYRFKDLYLSGGAYLGGTAAANKLDDYEEGLWTPVYQSASGSFTTMTMYNNLTNKPRYTKIGNLVTVSGYIDTASVVVGTASGDLLIDNLPFEALISASGSVSVTGLWAGDNPLSVSVDYQSTSLRIQYRTSVNGDDIDMNVSDLTTGTGLAIRTNGMAFTITYTTAE